MRRCLPSIYRVCIAIVFITACSSSAETDLPDEVKKLDNVAVHEFDEVPVSYVTLTEAATFEDTEKISIGQITAVDVDDRGNVYLVEASRGNTRIYVFDREGSFKHKIGRPGKGPGEFQALFDIKVSGDQIFTLDGTLRRIQVFSTESHELVHEAILKPSQWDHSGERTMTYPNKFFVLDDSTILAGFVHMTFDFDTRTFYRLDIDGNVTSDKLLTQNFTKHLKTPDSPRSFYDPFGGRVIR